MMFGYPTCASDVYTPKVEQIFLPDQEDMPELPVEIKVAKKYTWEIQATNWKWKLFEQMIKIGRHKQSLDYEGHFIFDARGETDKNIAHLLENICTPVLLAKKLISQHLKRPVEINVILKENASKLAQDLFNTLDIPILCTNFEVYGNVVEAIYDYRYRLYGIEAELFNLEFKGYNPSTEERIFIARRGSRHLINNNEVAKFLEERGFVTYYFEDLTASEKWSIARNAKVVVAVHGAGTGNFIFNRLGLAPQAKNGSGLRIIELFSPSFTIHTYRQFSTVLNGSWCGVRGQITPEVLRYLDFDTSPRDTLKSPIRDPFKIDLSSLQMALDYLKVDEAKPNTQRLVHDAHSNR
ncbi:MAG: glycosyltransferase family 61 protein [Stenomitos rutilans HA7619-LM2]|nr:glycosyltransferase family 61 protein [Stenomitos rutilans HA7619-LM2]